MARFDASLSDVSFSFGPWPDSDAVHHHQPIGDVPVTWQLKRALTWVLWVLSRNLLSLVGSFWNRSRGPLWGDERGFEVPRICWIVDTVIVRERKWQNANKLTNMPITGWQFLWELEEWWFNERVTSTGQCAWSSVKHPMAGGAPGEHPRTTCQHPCGPCAKSWVQSWQRIFFKPPAMIWWFSYWETS